MKAARSEQDVHQRYPASSVRVSDEHAAVLEAFTKAVLREQVTRPPTCVSSMSDAHKYVSWGAVACR